MADYLKRYIHEDGAFKATVVSTTLIGRELFKTFNPTPDSLTLLTQAASGSLLLTSALLKSEGTLMVKAKGDGPVESLIAEANTSGQVRATLGETNLVVEAARNTLFGQAVGDGTLTIARKLVRANEPSQGVVPLVNGELAENLAHYLFQSEQVRSGIRLGVKLDAEHGVAGAGGVLIQALPDADPNLIFVIEERLAEMSSFGDLFSTVDAHAAVTDYLFSDMPIKWLRTTEVTYSCSCDRRRILQVLAAMPRTDIAELLSSKETVKLECSFCHKDYPVGEEDLQVILDMKSA